MTTGDVQPGDLPARRDDLLTDRSWRLVVVSLGGLVLGVLIASLVALVLTLSVGQVAERTLLEDVEFEDEAEDVHVAVLDLRRLHSNMALIGPTRAGIADQVAAVAALIEEITELEALGITPAGMASPGEMRDAVVQYDHDIAAAIPWYATDRARYDEAFDTGLGRLAVLEREASSLDEAGTARAADALRRLGDTTSTAAGVLVAVLLAVGAVALTLAVLALRVLRELRRLTESERAAAAGVRELLQTRTDFIADASHELRTPLTVLRGNAEYGLRMEPADCAHVPVLREVRAEAVRMTRLVEELLFVARHDAGGATIEVEEIELEAFAAEVTARAEVLTRQRGAPLEARMAIGGPARLDVELMQRAVLILVDNAAKFGPPQVPVELSAWTDGPDLVIQVADRGPGIAPDILPYIFDRFRHAKRSARGQGGAGLGLSIALAIVDAHGGRIVPSERPGGGTRMTISVPARIPSDAGAP